MPIGAVLAGLLAASNTDSVRLAKFLGFVNVFVGDTPWSYSQQGNFTSASWEVQDEIIDVIGPNTEWPNGKLILRTLLLHGKLVIFLFNGQSNDVGTVANMNGVVDPTPPFTVLAPQPGKYFCYTGGISPTQSGTGSPGVIDIINSLNFADIVDAHVNINTLRTPGDEVNAQQWACSFGQVVAAALPNDSAVLMIDVGHGGTGFTDDVQHAVLLTTAAWANNVVTFIFSSQTNIGVNDTFTIQSSTNHNYNGTFTAIASNGFTVTAVLVGNPGAYTGGGFGLVWSAPVVNGRNMIRRAVAQIAPALGLSPYFGGLGYNGNEASDSVNSVGAFLSQQYAVLFTLGQQLLAICGDGDNITIWPQVGYPAASWQITDNSLFNCAPNTALGVLAASQDPANKCITFGQYGAVAGGTGDVQTVACIHYGVQGHDDHGAIGGNKWIDYKLSLDTTPLQLLGGEDVLVRVANSKNVATTFNRAAEIDTAMYVADPGHAGYQFFTGVTNIAGNDGGNGLDEPVASVTVNGTTAFGLTTTNPATRSWGNFVGYGYNNATRFGVPNNTQVIDFSWSATGGGQGTFTLASAQNFNVGDPVVFAQMVPIGANVIPAGNAIAGTGGSTVVMSMPVNPGTVAVSTSTWAAGIATYHTAAAVYTDGNTITATGNGTAGYNTTGVILSHTATSFTMAIADPGGSGSGGTVHGGGNVANNGTYGVGRTQGLRGQVREPVFAHYSNDTGAPLLSGVAAIQFIQTDVYASTKSIASALTELTL